MTSKTTNKFSPDVRARAVRMVLDGSEYPSRWAAIEAIAPKIGYSGHTLLEWVVNWSGRVCFHLRPIGDRMCHHLARADRLFTDETTKRVGIKNKSCHCTQNYCDSSVHLGRLHIIRPESRADLILFCKFLAASASP